MAQETKTKIRITKGLQDVVSKNKLIKEVYFNEEGSYYLNKHTVDIYETDEHSQTTGIKTVDCLQAFLGVVMVSERANGVLIWKAKKKNISYMPIHSTLSRKEILEAVPVSDTRTEKEKLEILRAAAEIAKDSDIQGLLDKINKQKN